MQPGDLVRWSKSLVPLIGVVTVPRRRHSPGEMRVYWYLCGETGPSATTDYDASRSLLVPVPEDEAMLLRLAYPEINDINHLAEE